MYMNYFKYNIITLKMTTPKIQIYTYNSKHAIFTPNYYATNINKYIKTYQHTYPQRRAVARNARFIQSFTEIHTHTQITYLPLLLNPKWLKNTTTST